MRDKPVCMDHEIVWRTYPFLLAVPVGHFLGVCRICGATFEREQRVENAEKEKGKHEHTL